MRGGATLSLVSVLADTAIRRPEHTALVSGPERISYGALWLAARRCATVLRERGVGPGDRVALLLPNTPAFPTAYFGVLALGATVVPVNALLKAEEIAYILRHSQARLLLCAGSLLGEGDPAARRADVPLMTVDAEAGDTGRPGPDALDALDVLAADAEPLGTPVPRAPDDIALVLYTSGTTGRPKGVLLSHLNLVMNIDTTALSPFAMEADDVLLGCLPLFHTFGQVCGMGTCFRVGATLVLTSRFTPDEALDLMVRERCTVLMGVPTMYLGLLEAAARDPRRPPLARAYSGGSALPVPVLQDIEATFGCPVYEGYGLTEASPCVAYNQPARPRRPGTVGRPVRGVEAEIARSGTEDRIVLLPAGEVGEIVVRGHNVMTGYLDDPEATAAVLVDGWLRTGDLGVKDAEGCLTIVDRKKDMIVRGGYNVYPREVEEVLTRHRSVARVAVVGVPDARYGQEVCAVVVPRPGAAPDAALAEEIVGWSRRHMAAYKYPRRVEFAATLPLGPSGKVLKRELAALLRPGTGGKS
ncbi:putative long-chain-fatty-acid-CoA ligase [Streptomyces lincolnensis]|uniref:Putative long-chain-fatty-acid-CoA ligase n=1 Tax=Streptomyces lincolnensis TaxID=1915 RepID=A0A1B1MIY9_STRLN|nr:long-chain fatty acid--CoA ligase [Streptomyces lincolnensis]ANS68571.1 putative long-chain-fatty-acid-CoA ligase [Streptomyces lincolnensis]AXG53223.1 putative long-chain-fatty-acid-CoA ligase [Streptomyces lincolnensis]QMV10191.1 AMP-binding protein [Streptomyces lincolnensis]